MCLESTDTRTVEIYVHFWHRRRTSSNVAKRWRVTVICTENIGNTQVSFLPFLFIIRKPHRTSSVRQHQTALRLAHMTKHFFNTVPRCLPWMLSSRWNKKLRKLHLFSPSSRLEFVTMDILSLTPERERQNKCIVVMTNRLSMLTKAITAARMSAKRNANIFVECWMASFEISSILLSDIWYQFTSKHFAAVRKCLSVKLVATTRYQTQSNR